MKTNYEKQAMDFLEKTGCKMTITYKENRRYFLDDKETRDVYDVKIERGKRVWKFEFGNSIKTEFVACMESHKNTIRNAKKENMILLICKIICILIFLGKSEE